VSPATRLRYGPATGRRILSRPTVRVGLVGSGFAARFHASAYGRVHGVTAEIVAVTSAHESNAARFAAEHDIATVYKGVDDLLADPTIDVVDICVPNMLHADVATRAARAGKHIIVEKPLTGFFGEDGAAREAVGLIDRATMLRGALASADAVIDAARKSGVLLCYAENWVYAPAVQKIDRLLTAAAATILRIDGEESHSGSHSPFSGSWHSGGGGSLLWKACHPLGAALYLKYAEGRRRNGRPIRPAAVQAQVATLTRTAHFGAGGSTPIRIGYHDVEDWGAMLLTFEDGAVAQITGSDIVLGGVRNRLEVFADRCVVAANLSPTNAAVAYAASPTTFGDEYIVEKAETKGGWSFPAPDEEFLFGFPHEIQDFAEAVAFGREPKSGALLARDVLVVVYGAYLAASEARSVDLRTYLADV
jgi:predicted dehydrogenase